MGTLLLEVAAAILCTVLAYRIARAFCWAIAVAWLHPTLVAIGLIVTGLAVTGVSQTRYFDAAAPLHWLLLPAFALLAVPLKRFFPRIQRHPEAVVAAVAIGGPVACLSAILLPFLAGVAPEITASLAPKSVTTSVAVDITQALGGLPGLTAVVVVTTGLVGMSLGPPLFQALRIRDEAAQGLPPLRWGRANVCSSD
jgi:putative effector of murein hydrolase